MSSEPEPAADLSARVLAHLLARVRLAEVRDEPFGHAYFEGLLPADVYDALLARLPPAGRYVQGPRGPNAPHGVRLVHPLTADAVRRWPAAGRDVWRAVVAALTDPALKRCLFARLAPDLMRRYGVAEADVPGMAGHARPTLYRDSDGYGLAPHPDTLEKVVTMHLYLPADLSRVGLGTTLYRRGPGPVSRDDRRAGFVAVRKFEFRPNSGYAFVVSDSADRRSWHGCEPLPDDAGVRDTLLNAFYAEPRGGYSGYLEDEVEADTGALGRRRGPGE